MVEQGTLFAVLDVGVHVKVFHESGDLEGAGEVVAMTWHGMAPHVVCVRMYAGYVVIRPAARVVVNEDVTVL